MPNLPSFSLTLKVLTAITVAIAVHELFLSGFTDDGRFTDDEPIPVPTHSESVSHRTSSTKSPENIISLDLKLKYPAILPPKTAVSEQMLLTLTTQDLSLNSRTPTDLVLVVDTSSSMDGEKINLLKDTLKYMLTMLSCQDRLSIVRFSTSAERLTPLKLVNELNEKYFINVIENLYANG